MIRPQPQPPAEIDGTPLTERELEMWHLEIAACRGARESSPEEYATNWVRRSRASDKQAEHERSGPPQMEIPPEEGAAYERAIVYATQKWRIEKGELSLYANTRARHWIWAVLACMYKNTTTARIVGAQKGTVDRAVSEMKNRYPALALEAERFAAGIKAMARTEAREECAA